MNLLDTMGNREMKLSQFKFKLPEELIALYPTEERDEARLMVVESSFTLIFASFARSSS